MEIVRLENPHWQRLRALRLAALADAPDAFGATLAEAERFTEKHWRQQLDALATYVAVLDGADAGMARGVADRSDPRNACLVSMWVLPAARVQGVGEALIRAVIDWARAAGHARLLLDVADGNQPALRLYERLGFQRTGETGSLPAPREHITEHRRALELIGR